MRGFAELCWLFYSFVSEIFLFRPSRKMCFSAPDINHQSWLDENHIHFRDGAGSKYGTIRFDILCLSHRHLSVSLVGHFHHVVGEQGQPNQSSLSPMALQVCDIYLWHVFQLSQLLLVLQDPSQTTAKVVRKRKGEREKFLQGRVIGGDNGGQHIMQLLAC
jgi:hypothetical protein